jgi:hypothetical protein
MTAFAKVTRVSVDPLQVYRARSLAERAGDVSAQNAIERFLDVLAMPMALGGLACAFGFPMVMGAAATQSVTASSVVQSKGGIAR